MGQYYVYIMTNKLHTVLYTGMTNNLIRRSREPKEKRADSFTKRYNVTKLVYYEVAETAYAAISREKQIKAGSRRDKLNLIAEMNPAWVDLYETIV
ncbi:MAG: GIY-YIG nuclease family protein [Trueperaceae bacterium]